MPMVKSISFTLSCPLLCFLLYNSLYLISPNKEYLESYFKTTPPPMDRPNWLSEIAGVSSKSM